MPYYARSFFDGTHGGATESAALILPIVFDLLHPTSIADIGCGIGSWLTVGQKLGATRVMGVDGDWVDPAMLQIPHENFHPADLRKPLALSATFDLAMSLEVAEHIPEENAGTFVESLVRLAPAILFSAAIPRQGGNFHVNEQWQGYWADRFSGHGYVPVDCVRPAVWTNNKVAYWYAQNTILYVKPELLNSNPKLAAARAATQDTQLSIVHPLLFSMRSKQSKFKRLVQPMEQRFKRFRERFKRRKKK